MTKTKTKAGKISYMFCPLDGHFELLNGSEPQKLWHKMQMGRLLIDDDALVSSPCGLFECGIFL